MGLLVFISICREFSLVIIIGFCYRYYCYNITIVIILLYIGESYHPETMRFWSLSGRGLSVS